MSTVKLTLRPPPHVDFVQGYPGIPPGGDRPQAAVKGALEVRLGANGAKSKWVRVELRKVETLPGGGVHNTFYDYVGQSPVTLWQSDDDFSVLQTQDFPFYIRIPESIPPSLGLEKEAGIKYELIASICVKTKGGFFRRGKSRVEASSAQILIDKHELHSTWPVYQQRDIRSTSNDGITLTVERSSTCFGPGDPINVSVSLKSDRLHNVIVRGLELSLKETTIFRSQANGKRGAPQVKVAIIGEQKLGVNKTLYGGAVERADLSCSIPPSHTNASVSSARHIDITYLLSVRALLDTSAPLVLDLPIIISNWQRVTSSDAINRIGPAPSLSLSNNNGPTGAFNYAQPTNRVENFRPNPAEPDISNYSTVPNGQANNATTGGLLGADEFGSPRQGANGGSAPAPVESPRANYKPLIEPYRPPGTIGPKVAPKRELSSRDGSEPNSQEGQNKWPTQTEKDLYNSARAKVERVQGPAALAVSDVANNKPLSAADEKAILWDRARAQVDTGVNGAAAKATAQAAAITTVTPAPLQAPAPAPAPAPISAPKPLVKYPTAEEEKAALFREAQAKVSRAQGLGSAASAASPIQVIPTATSSGGPSNTSSPIPQPASIAKPPSSSGYGGGGAGASSGAALYRDAMANINRGATAAAAGQPAIGGASSYASPPPSRFDLPQPGSIPNYQSAEQEKAALARYHQAQDAVNRNQGISDSSAAGSSSPIAYDSLYPGQQPQYQNTSAYAVTNPSVNAPVSAFSGGTENALSEKEKLRRRYEEQDRAAEAAAAAPPAPLAYDSPPTQSYPSNISYGDPPPTASYSQPPPSASYMGYTSAPPAASGSSSPPSLLDRGNPLTEKEILRRKYEAQDAAAAASVASSAQPIPSYSQAPGYAPAPAAIRSARSPPPLPAAAASRPLTAAEEKALMQAKYDAEEAQQATGSSSPPAPPPPRQVTGQSSSAAYMSQTPSGPPPGYP